MARRWTRPETMLRELIEAGKIKPVIDRRYALTQIPDPLRYLESGEARGKIVITIWRSRHMFGRLGYRTLAHASLHPCDSTAMRNRRSETWSTDRPDTTAPYPRRASPGGTRRLPCASSSAMRSSALVAS